MKTDFGAIQQKWKMRHLTSISGLALLWLSKVKNQCHMEKYKRLCERLQMEVVARLDCEQVVYVKVV